MFAHNYFAGYFFAPRYFPPAGGVIIPPVEIPTDGGAVSGGRKKRLHTHRHDYTFDLVEEERQRKIKQALDELDRKPERRSLEQPKKEAAKIAEDLEALAAERAQQILEEKRKFLLSQNAAFLMLMVE